MFVSKKMRDIEFKMMELSIKLFIFKWHIHSKSSDHGPPHIPILYYLLISISHWGK